MSLSLQNLPTPKEEAWKYTNLPKAMPADLTPASCVQMVEITRGGREEISWTGRHGEIHTPRLTVTLGEGEELTLIERYAGEGAYWNNPATQISLGKGARLYHYRFQGETLEAVHTNMAQITLADGAIYEGFTLTHGAKLSRHEIHVSIEGQKARCDLNGVNLLGGKQHGDTTILVKHQAPNSQSNQFYRSVLADQARGVFQGKVCVDRIAQQTDANQLSNALLLSRLAEMDTKPELEIYADDVKCSHGATTGQIGEEALFYMQSRGIPENQARALLIEGFLNEVSETIADEAVRTEILEKMQIWLEDAHA